MHLQTLRSVGMGWDSSPSQVCASGDVRIHPSAAIAPGVILQAAPNSRILIAEGVCVGMGTVLNACEGAIEIANGATLGAGVLMVGSGKIGSRACVGAATTIFNQSIDPWQVVPAGSLIGDSSRSVEGFSVDDPNGDTQPKSIPVSLGETPEKTPEKKHSIPTDTKPQASHNGAAPEASDVEAAPNEEAPDPKVDKETPVYGQVHVNRILWTIFPQGRSPNSPP